MLKIVNPSGQTVVSFTYDAWGNFTLTPNSEVDRTEITFAAAFNPIFYRGYLYDYETGLYYLQSRYYNPEIGRFVNADTFYSTGFGALGCNQYAYCLNNPIVHVDPTGQIAATITIMGVPVSIGAILAVSLSLLYLVDDNIRSSVNNSVILLLVKAPGAIINAIKRIAQSVKDARTKAKTKKTNNHHIVAKNEPRAKQAQDILKYHTIDINHKLNLVKLNQNFHQHLHTTAYYTGVNTVIDKGNKIGQKSGVFASLLILHGALKLTNSIFF